MASFFGDLVFDEIDADDVLAELRALGVAGELDLGKNFEELPSVRAADASGISVVPG
jgi:hypothetical protein